MASSLPRNESNRTCQLCGAQGASVFCACRSQTTLLCDHCSALHQAKNRLVLHQVLPIVALEYGPEEYMRKCSALMQGATALRRNVELMQQFYEEFTTSVETAVNYLTKWQEWLLQWAQNEQEQVKSLVEAAIQEAESCLAQGSQPSLPLSQALWTLAPEELKVFSYSVAALDLETLTQTWVTWQNNMSGLFDRFLPKSPVEPSQISLKRRYSPAEAKSISREVENPGKRSEVAVPVPQPMLLMCIEEQEMQVWNFPKKAWDRTPLSARVAVDPLSRWVWMDAGLFCSGGTHLFRLPRQKIRISINKGRKRDSTCGHDKPEMCARTLVGLRKVQSTGVRRPIPESKRQCDR